MYRSVAPTTSPNFDSAAKHEGELTLLNLTNKAQDVLQIARPYTVFDFMADEPAAVKSYGQFGSGNCIPVVRRDPDFSGFFRKRLG